MCDRCRVPCTHRPAGGWAGRRRADSAVVGHAFTGETMSSRSSVARGVAATFISAGLGSLALSWTASTTASAAVSSPVGAAAPTVDELARSVVQVSWLEGEWKHWGSGSVITDDGLILTNAHVVTSSESAPDVVDIAVTGPADAPPAPTYHAQVIARDVPADLAVLRISSSLDGAPYEIGSIPPIPIADSDAVQIGDDLQILGYPGIGGETITYTSGEVSGFTGDATFGNRAWIKTDATIAGGNSGGLAANVRGELVGVPTQAAAGTDTDMADCRPVRDTNTDGQIDEDDDCVPIGGFLNGIRPANLARDLIAAAQGTGGADPGQSGLPQAPESFDASAVTFGSLALTDVQPQPRPPSDLVWVGSTSRLCGGWNYSGMADGVRWDAVWALNGAIQEAFSLVDQVWTGGEAGDWWVCAALEGTTLDEGIWDLTLNVEGELVTGAFIGVGAALEPVTFTFANASPAEVCFVNMSPTVSTYWGRDWLGPEQTIPAGESVSFSLPATMYDIRGLDCSGSELLRDTVEVSGPTTYTHAGSGSEGSAGVTIDVQGVPTVFDCTAIVVINESVNVSATDEVTESSVCGTLDEQLFGQIVTSDPSAFERFVYSPNIGVFTAAEYTVEATAWVGFMACSTVAGGDLYQTYDDLVRSVFASAGVPAPSPADTQRAYDEALRLLCPFTDPGQS